MLRTASGAAFTELVRRPGTARFGLTAEVRKSFEHKELIAGCGGQEKPKRQARQLLFLRQPSINHLAPSEQGTGQC
jgi:hypothetical protein